MEAWSSIESGGIRFKRLGVIKTASPANIFYGENE